MVLMLNKVFRGAILGVLMTVILNPMPILAINTIVADYTASSWNYIWNNRSYSSYMGSK